MNLPTAIVLLVVAVLLVLAIRSLWKARGSNHCAGCSHDGCPSRGSGAACPAAQRALADVEAELGPVDHDS